MVYSGSGRERARRIVAIGALVAAFASPGSAGDEDIFTAQVPPNVLLMVDNSGSMNAIMEHEAFDAAAFAPTCDVLPAGGSGGQYISDENGDQIYTYCWPNQCVFRIKYGWYSDWVATPDPDDHPRSGYISRTFCGETRKLYSDGINYSYNNEGGFVQILGANVDCGYRYNISVRDGSRVEGVDGALQNGRLVNVSNFCNIAAGCPSAGNFIYNNTI